MNSPLYRLKEPLPQEIIPENVTELSQVILDIKRAASADFRKQHSKRVDNKTEISVEIFRTLNSHAERYADYRFHQANRNDITESHKQSVAHLATCGIGEHVSEQFLHMAEKTIDCKIDDQMGWAIG